MGICCPVDSIGSHDADETSGGFVEGFAAKERTLPYATGSDTSREAAESMEEFAPHVAEAMWGHLVERGPQGLTGDEMIVLMPECR